MNTPFRFPTFVSASILVFTLGLLPLSAAVPPEWGTTGEDWLDAYFAAETERLAEGNLSEIRTREDWENHKERYRNQLKEMLGLLPEKPRTDLKATITGTVEHGDFVVEKLHYQSLPGFYVTANLYRPKEAGKPLPGILYVCGHGRVKKNGISYGNKATYQHHGAWFARNGYVCLTIDTVQLGEIEGIHHGTYREKMWWWNSRGYTSAGAEAWNCIRALDYLQSRKEVDGERLGVTGRSGGGAYSWWISALDERIKVSVPVAGITDLENHVVDGCVEGHCDCMFMVNTYRWDYSKLAALVAPRPLLISNTDKDRIFPLDGVVRVHQDVARIYGLLGASDKLGLLITEGPHKDTQQLRVPAFHWFNRWLKGEAPPIAMPAEKLFEPEELRVFSELPEAEITSHVHDTFVPMAEAPSIPKTRAAWAWQRNQWLAQLQKKSFAGWPAEPGALKIETAWSAATEGVELSAADFTSQEHVRLRVYVLKPERGAVKGVEVHVAGRDDWEGTLASLAAGFSDQLQPEVQKLGGKTEASETAFAQLAQAVKDNARARVFVLPRGVGLTDWQVGIKDPNKRERKHTQIRRRFQLLGQTADGMRVWDIRRGLQAVRSMKGLGDVPVSLRGREHMAVNALYASLFEPGIAELHLTHLPASHMQGPDYLNVLRFLDIPQALAMAAERSKIHLYGTQEEAYRYSNAVWNELGWPEVRTSR